MENLIQTTTKLAIHIAGAYVRPESLVIDATCGNGGDTLQLAAMNPARPIAFDREPEAVRITREKLTAHGYAKAMQDGRITAICLPHERMAEYFKSPAAGDGITPAADLIVFNLGYLPGADRRTATSAETTLPAVRQALNLLAENGLLCITMYSGHEAGKKEKSALLAFAEELDSHLWHTAHIRTPNQKKDPPEILLITRKRVR